MKTREETEKMLRELVCSELTLQASEGKVRFGEKVYFPDLCQGLRGLITSCSDLFSEDFPEDVDLELIKQALAALRESLERNALYLLLQPVISKLDKLS